MTESFEPLSVRRGRRDPLPYVDGIPNHIYLGVMEWVKDALSTVDERVEMLMAAKLSIVPGATYYHGIIDACRKSEDIVLDVVDYIFRQGICLYKNQALELGEILDAGRSLWTVGFPEDGSKPYLQRRVPESVEKRYLAARATEGLVKDQLTLAWHKAYGREEDAEGSWKAAIKAVEATLGPIVTPRNSGASLGQIRASIADGEKKDKWVCSLPLWGDETVKGMTSVQAFLQVLSRLPFDVGRHGTDNRQADITQARAVMDIAVVIINWVNQGVFKAAK
ncbi:MULTISPECIES: hypothetical protein [Kocuria]|uniref:hypothetical protein n=1 Tax=Kocuria TaxID=57493 RepID=UPI0012E81220|nr:hypothetical protein [Kocuria sp. ICS0012]